MKTSTSSLSKSQNGTRRSRETRSVDKVDQSLAH
jgi:hypothetical protein